MNSIYKNSIAETIKVLRQKRGFSQAEFAQIFNITQAGLSHIENGKSSLSAEQLITLIEKFNLSIGDFVKQKKVPEEQELQNAMARFGAKHLKEFVHVIVPERFLDINEVIFQVLSASHHSRLIAHLAPVIVAHVDTIHFMTLSEKLFLLKKQNRIWWLAEQIYEALQRRINDTDLSPQQSKSYQKAQRPLKKRKEEGEVLNSFRPTPPGEYDILDKEIISWKYTSKLQEGSDDIAKKWHIISSLKTEDFYQVLKETDEYDQ